MIRVHKADIRLLNICMGFQDLMSWNGGLGDKIEEGVVQYWPLTNTFFLLRVFTSVLILVKIDKKNATVRVVADAQTDWHTDRRKPILAVVVRPSVCRLSVTFVHPTQAIEIFGNLSTRHLVPWPSINTQVKFYGSSQGNPSVGEVKHKRGSQI